MVNNNIKTQDFVLSMVDKNICTSILHRTLARLPGDIAPEFLFSEPSGSLELMVIFSFRSVNLMRVFDPLDGTLIHRRIAPSKRWYSFIDLEQIES